MTARETFKRWVRSVGGSGRASDLIGCSRSYVDMIIKGVRRPGLRVAHAIERVSSGAIAMRSWVE